MRPQPQGTSRLRSRKRQLGDIALVEIGGITPERVPLVMNHGADSAAVVTDVLRNPERPTVEWLQASTNAR
ncbi:thiamine phosphate synthase [Rhizobium brockwellii]|uniref:thiamine phosphate synthase n=1 Tax=Rhizobium TaxID=379 RepID=UPI003F9A255E